jgi:threonyl-tRNA synthetase
MIHAAEFSFHVTQETSVAAAAGDVAEEDKSGSSGDSLVCFVSVEKKDEDAPERVVAEAVRKIVEHHRRVDAETLWLYPYAHLSSDLASPRMARRILDLMWDGFRAANAARKLARAPFGYYKAFHIEAKGHRCPSRRSRSRARARRPAEADAGRVGRGARGEEAALALLRGDDRTATSSRTRSSSSSATRCSGVPQLRGRRNARVTEEPPHMKLMRHHELVDYEASSDAGNFRWYRRGSSSRACSSSRSTRS